MSVDKQHWSGAVKLFSKFIKMENFWPPSVENDRGYLDLGALICADGLALNFDDVVEGQFIDVTIAHMDEITKTEVDESGQLYKASGLLFALSPAWCGQHLMPRTVKNAVYTIASDFQAFVRKDLDLWSGFAPSLTRIISAYYHHQILPLTQQNLNEIAAQMAEFDDDADVGEIARRLTPNLVSKLWAAFNALSEVPLMPQAEHCSKNISKLRAIVATAVGTVNEDGSVDVSVQKFFFFTYPFKKKT